MGTDAKLFSSDFLPSVFLLLLVGVLDYLTGYELGFFIFYYLPISLAAWQAGRRKALLLSFFAAAVWFAADSLSDHPYSLWIAAYWNTAIRLAAFVTIALCLSRIRESLENEKRLAGELSAALEEVKRLSGLLPICASCKAIRNDRGEWQKIEHYIRDHSEADFSHSICPECRKQLYPGLKQREPQV